MFLLQHKIQSDTLKFTVYLEAQYVSLNQAPDYRTNNTSTIQLVWLRSLPKSYENILADF